MVASLDMLSPAVRRRMESIFQNERAIFSDTRITQMLMEFPEDMAMAALNEFAFAEQDLSNSIRSRPAYLMGVLRKYRSGERSRSKPGKPHVGGGGGGSDSYRHDRDYSPVRRSDYRNDRHDDHNSGPPPSYSGYAPPVSQQQQPQQQKYSSNPNYSYGGGGQPSNYGGGHGTQPYSSAPQQSIQPPQQNQYPPSTSQNRAETNQFSISHRVRTRLEQMYGTGIVRRDQIDARCVEYLAQMPDELALQSLDEFSNHDTSTIRNHSAFLMSILRKNQTGANSQSSAYYSNPQDNAPCDSRQQGPPSSGMKPRQPSYGGSGGDHSPPHSRGGGAYGQPSYDAPPVQQQQSVNTGGGYGGSSGGPGGSFSYPPSESTSPQSSYLSPSYSSQQQQPPPQQQQYVPYDSQGGQPPAAQGGGGYPPAQQQHQPSQYGGAPPPQQGDTPMMSSTSSYGGGDRGGHQRGSNYSPLPLDQGSHQQYASPPKGQHQQMIYYDYQQQPQSQYQSGSGGGGGSGSYPPPQGGGGYNQQHQSVQPPHGGGDEFSPTSSYQQSHQGGYGGSPSMPNQQPPSSHYVPPPGFEGIPAAVVARVERLFQIGFMTRDEFDERMVDQLRGVPEDEAVSAVDEFGTCSRKKIRKIGAYFNGVLRKHISRLRERQDYVKHPHNRSHKRRHSRSRSRERFDSDRGGGSRDFGRGGPRSSSRDIPPRGRDRDDNDFDRTHGSRSSGPPPQGRQHNYRSNDSRGGPPTNNDHDSGNASIPLQQPPSLPNIRNVSDKVYFTLRALVAQGLINASEIDDRLGNALAQMDEGQAILALDEFGACDLERVRNRGGYLMGLVKRYRGDGSSASSDYFTTHRGSVPPHSSETVTQHQDAAGAAPASDTGMSTTPLEDHSTITAGVSTAIGSAVHVVGDSNQALTSAVPPSSTTVAMEGGNAVIGDGLGGGAPTGYNTPGAMPSSLPYSVDVKPAMTMNTGGPRNSSNQSPTEVCQQQPESVLGTVTATKPVAYDPEAFTMDVSSLSPTVGALQQVVVQQQQAQTQQSQVTNAATAEAEMDTSKPTNPSFPTVTLAQVQEQQVNPTVMQPIEVKVGEQTTGTVMTPAVARVTEQYTGSCVVLPVESQVVQGQVANSTGVIPAEVQHVGEQASGTTTVPSVETQVVPSQLASGTVITAADVGPGTASTAPVVNALHPSGMEAHPSSNTFIDPSTSQTGDDVANMTNSSTAMSDSNAASGNSTSNPIEVSNKAGDVGGPDATCSKTQGEDKNRIVNEDVTYSLPNSTETDPMGSATTSAVAAVATSMGTSEKGEDVIDRFPSPL